jgi:hypothetical protein
MERIRCSLCSERSKGFLPERQHWLQVLSFAQLANLRNIVADIDHATANQQMDYTRH